MTNLPDHPEISIIVCCYNAADTVRCTLESLRRQNFKSIEILAIDDGSTDDTLALLRCDVALDKRMRVLNNGRNRGTAYTRQLGLEEARAPLVLFFDADDIALPDMVSNLHNKLTSDPTIMGCSCYAEYFDGDRSLGHQRIGSRTKEEFLLSYANNKLYFQSIVTLISRDLALSVGGFRTDLMQNETGIRYEDYAEDLDLWCRMADLGADGRYFVTVPKVLFRYRKPLESTSTTNLVHMQLKMRWIKDCLRRRRTGHAERSLKEFIVSRGVWQRLTDWRSDRAAEFYKKAGFSYARHNYISLVCYLLLAGLHSPKLIRQKITTQTVL